MVMVFAGGHISGAHYNPAVTLGVLIRGKVKAADVIPYWIAQFLAAVVAALVRYHNRKSEPGGHHPAYSALEDADKPIARRLAAILRIAEALDHSHRQRVMKLRASFQHRAVGLQIDARGDAAEDLLDANRSAELFEKEFHVKLYFRQTQAS